MKVRLEHVSFYLLIGTLLLAIGYGDAFTCPEHCSCIELQRVKHAYNHARCTSLDGLRQLGKTSELHSLDLSSLNLTKINNQLDKLTNLSKLDLSDNRLSEINSLSTKRIRNLNLSGNRITSGKLAKIPSTVKYLNLSFNDITILTDSFKRFDHLTSLELADNPLNCTCETLEIRNWLQERQVWTEKPIRCMAPMQFKGRSWLQARQSEVCDPNGLETPRMLPSSDTTDDIDNDLMMGDDPNVGQTEDLAQNDEGFLPVSANRAKRTDNLSELTSDNADENVEGSGSDLNEENDPDVTDTDAEVTTAETETLSKVDLYEGSGESTAEPQARQTNFNALTSNETDTDSEFTTITAADELSTDQSLSPLIEEDETEANTISSEAPIISKVNIEDDNNTTAVEGLITDATLPPSIASEDETQKEAETEHNTTVVPAVVEEPIVPSKSTALDTEYVQTGEGAKDGARSESTKIDNSDLQQSKSTYILLAVLGILLVALLLYVATKRSRTNVKNRRNNNDIESPAQELLTMDKNNLGKPIQNPVEFIPLIPDKHDPEKKANVCNGEEPLLQKLTEVENENEPHEDHHKKTTDDNKQQTPTQQLNGNAKPVQNGVHADKIDDNNLVNDQRQYQSISPKPSRYSPVSVMSFHSLDIDSHAI